MFLGCLDKFWQIFRTCFSQSVFAIQNHGSGHFVPTFCLSNPSDRIPHEIHDHKIKPTFSIIVCANFRINLRLSSSLEARTTNPRAAGGRQAGGRSGGRSGGGRRAAAVGVQTGEQWAGGGRTDGRQAEAFGPGPSPGLAFGPGGLRARPLGKGRLPVRKNLRTLFVFIWFFYTAVFHGAPCGKDISAPV